MALSVIVTATPLRIDTPPPLPPSPPVIVRPFNSIVSDVRPSLSSMSKTLSLPPPSRMTSATPSAAQPGVKPTTEPNRLDSSVTPKRATTSSPAASIAMRSPPRLAPRVDDERHASVEVERIARILSGRLQQNLRVVVAPEHRRVEGDRLRARRAVGPTVLAELDRDGLRLSRGRTFPSNLGRSADQRQSAGQTLPALDYLKDTTIILETQTMPAAHLTCQRRGL